MISSPPEVEPSRDAESASLRSMMAAPQRHFQSGVHEQWSGERPIRCISCGSIRLYTHGDETECQQCLAPLPVEEARPATRTVFRLSLGGELLQADAAWENVTDSKVEEASGLGWMHQIDPQVFVSLHKHWPLVAVPGGEFSQMVSLGKDADRPRPAHLVVTNVGTYLQGELTVFESDPVVELSPSRSPMVLLGSVAAVALVLCSVILIWMIYPSNDVAVVPKSTVEDRASLYSVASLDAAVRLVEEFHRSSSAEEKSRFVLPFASMERDMGFHYAVHGNEPRAVEEITKRGFHRNGERLFCAIQGRYHHSGTFLAMIELRTNEPMRLDWQAFTGAGEVPWRDFLNNTPKEEVTMRLLAKPDDFFGNGIMDDGEHDCYQLTDIDGQQSCYGYVRRRSETGRTLKDFFGDKVDSRTLHGPFQASIASARLVETAPKRVTLKVGALTGGGTARPDAVQVMIHDLVHLDWVGPRADGVDKMELAMRSEF